MKNLLFSILIIFFSCSQTNKSGKEIISDYTIAFGSCSKQDLAEAQLWNEVMAENPDLWIWLGDNIYADTEDMDVMKEKYDLQKSNPNYQNLINQTDIIGIWDDHDFGAPDGGKEYPKRKESKELMFDFLDVRKENPAWERKGAYQSYVYEMGDKVIKVILLDARYFRDSFEKDSNYVALPNFDGEVLGDEQWDWFEKELADETINLFLVGSGIQVVAKEHRFEKWANFPNERKKLLNIVAKKVGVPLIFLSGDRHMSEVSKLDLEGYEFPLYEITSSSLTSPWDTPNPEPNTYRIGEITYERNFAVITIFWVEDAPSLKLKYVGVDNEVLREASISY